MYTRQAADGPFLDVEGELSGTIVQQSVRCSPIMSGPITTDVTEIKEVMPNGGPTLRPELFGVHRTSELNIVLDYDVEFPETWSSSPITSTLQVSVDASEWETVYSRADTFAAPSKDAEGDAVPFILHQRAEAVVNPASIAVWPVDKPLATVAVRATVVRGAGAGTPQIFSEDDGTAAIVFQEIR